MPTKKFLCLAKSRKNGQWCIAGIDSEGRWVRLVNPEGAELSDRDIEDEEGNQPKVLETWEAEVLEADPLYFQPENLVIDKSYYWRYSDDPIYPDLDDLCTDEEHILDNWAARLSTFSLMLEPISRSLIMIYVQQVIFQKTTNARNHIQVRAIFQYKEYDYDLVVTDPVWEKLFNGPNADYPDFGNYLFKGGYYLTIGLGEEFNGYHYKLVVAVIPLEDLEDELSQWE